MTFRRCCRTQTPLASRISFWLLLGLLAGMVTTGCSGTSDKLPSRVPVTGTVIYEGKPVPNATVTFYPEGADNPGLGTTDAEGKFSLTTYKKDDGVVPGSQVVVVEVFVEGALPGMEHAPGTKPAIPLKYTRKESSPLRFEVQADKPNEFEIKLES